MTFSADTIEDNMHILVAKKAGFCEGVERALNMVMSAIEKYGPPLYTFGPLIHNPQVVEYLETLGVHAAETIDEIPDGSRVVIRSHGIGPHTREKLEKKNIDIIDASCMYVIKPQRLLKKLHDDGYTLLILGTKDHPEIRAFREFVNDEAYIANSMDELPDFSKNPPEKLGVIAQTTLNTEFFEKAIIRLKSQVRELVVKNTICDATIKRQEAARDIAGEVDAMVVIGGRRSSNTRKLTDICREKGVDSYQVEHPSELKPGWFIGRKRVGITAGASTPDWMIKEVIRAVEAFGFDYQVDEPEK